MERRAKVELFEQIRKEYELLGVARKLGGAWCAKRWPAQDRPILLLHD